MSYDRWTWTLNNPGDFRPHWDPLTMHYMIYSLERGAEGTPHLQGYTRFSKRLRLNAAKGLLGSQDFHLEKSNGSEKDNHDYCSKTDDTHLAGPWEFGTYKPEAGNKGTRNDLKQACALIASGGSQTAGKNSAGDHRQVFPPIFLAVKTSITMAFIGLFPTLQLMIGEKPMSTLSTGSNSSSIPTQFAILTPGEQCHHNFM